MNQFTSNPGRELLVIRPHAVEDGMTAVLAVRDRKTVVVDLSGMDSSQAQRTADFVSGGVEACLLYTSPSPRDRVRSRMPSSA